MKFRHSVSILAVALVLSFGACKKKQAELAGIADGVVTESWIKSQVSLDAAKRDIDAAAAQKALETLKLWEPGDEISWDERTGDSGYYTFKNLSFAESDATIANLTISGLHMLDDDTAFADHFEMTDLSATDPDDDVTISIKSIHYVLPDAAKFIDVIKSLEGNDEASAQQMLNFQNMLKSGELNFSMGEGYIDDLSVKGEDVTMQIDFAGWSEDEDARKVSMLFKDISGQGEENGETFQFNLDNMSMKGLSLEYYDNMMANNISAINPFEPNVEYFQMDNFSINGGGLFMNLPKLHSWYTDKKAGKFQAITEMPSLVFGFDREPEDADLIEFKQGLNDLGYEQVEFSMTGKASFDENADLIDVETGQLSMTDGFDLNFDYKISGLKNMMEQMGAALDDADYTDAQSMNQANLDMVLDGLKAMNLHHFSMEFDDNSILEKSLNLAASKQDVGIDLIRQQAKGGVMMSTMAATSEYQAELSKDFADNLVKLIDEGGKFKFVIKPDEAFDLGKTFSDYAAWEAGYGAAVQAQIDNENVTEIIEPEPFDMDAVLKAMGIDFEHTPD